MKLAEYAEKFSECPNAFKSLESRHILHECSCSIEEIQVSDIVYLNTFPIIFEKDNPPVNYYLVLLIAKCPNCNQITTCGIIYDEAEDKIVSNRCLRSDVLLNLYHIYRNFSPHDTLINPILHPLLFMDVTLTNLIKYYTFQQSIRCSINPALACCSNLVKTVSSLKMPEELRQIINNYILLSTVSKISYVTMVASIYQNIPYDTIKQLLQTDTTPAIPLRKIYARKQPLPNFPLDMLDM